MNFQLPFMKIHLLMPINFIYTYQGNANPSFFNHLSIWNDEEDNEYKIDFFSLFDLS